MHENYKNKKRVQKVVNMFIEKRGPTLRCCVCIFTIWPLHTYNKLFLRFNMSKSTDKV